MLIVATKPPDWKESIVVTETSPQDEPSPTVTKPMNEYYIRKDTIKHWLKVQETNCFQEMQVALNWSLHISEWKFKIFPIKAVVKNYYLRQNEKLSNIKNIPFLMEYLWWIWLTTAKLNWAYLLQPYGNVVQSATSRYIDKWSTLFPFGKISIRLHRRINPTSKNQSHDRLQQTKSIISQ